MAILLGTQSNGETLPVQVNEFGQLVAKGIEGETGEPGTPGTPGTHGEPGAQGPPGADGGSFPLPPDPYEGAFLGWLNGELAWLGSPPVPVPAGIFGPIDGWNSDGVFTVVGDIPSQVAQGVYLYQCLQDGSIYVNGWNNSRLWSASASANDGFKNAYPISTAFDGTTTSKAITNSAQETVVIENMGLIGTQNIEMEIVGGTVRADGVEVSTGNRIDEIFTFTTQGLDRLEISGVEGFAYETTIYYIKANDSLLVDAGDYPTAPNLNIQVQSVSGQTIEGTSNRADDFTVGAYFRVPDQEVARWLYDGNLNKVITTMAIDNSKLDAS